MKISLIVCHISEIYECRLYLDLRIRISGAFGTSLEQNLLGL